MKKRMLALLSAALFVLPVFAGCNGGGASTGGGEVHEAENNPSYEYRNNYDETLDGELDGVITLDGVLDEDIWATKSYFTNGYSQDPDGYYAHYKLTAFPTKTGVVIGGQSYDTDMRRVDDYGSLAPDYNTGFEIYFFCLPKGADQNIAQPTIVRQYFLIDVNDNILAPTGARFLARTNVVGELGSGMTEGMSFEAFIPYSELGVESADIFNMLPIYRAFLPGSTGVTRLSWQFFPWIYTPAFYRFDENGYMNADREGAVIGDSKSEFGFSKSGNWDVSREAEGIVESKGANDQHVFFRDVYAEKVIFKATVTNKGTLASCDNNPQAGLMLMTANSNQTVKSFLINDRNVEHELVVIKNGSIISFYRDGVRVTNPEEDANYAGACYIGFYARQANAVYTDYKADVFNTDEELAKLAEAYGIDL